MAVGANRKCSCEEHRRSWRMGDGRVSIRYWRSPVRSATLKLSPLDIFHLNTKQNHIPLPSNLRFSLCCHIHLALDLVRSACINPVQQRIFATDSHGLWYPIISAYTGGGRRHGENHEGNRAQGPTPHSLLHHSASASSNNFQISTSMHRTSNLPSYLNNVRL
ncbi:hypothetical protein ARMGADRAFT_102485 [Armillaria gallica]|uniref:Uncharacterized protein n=1 Tax=Armillaria gallica TaxID=47427 RepID=A0A2H3CX49_ARMGA|nr:hypothetical protein ARMGADRAFT_102485 [Armillaria gallica]